MRAIAWLAVLTITPGIASAGGEHFVGSISTARLAAPGADSDLVHFGSGGSLSLLWIEDCRTDRLCGALEGSALFLYGDGEARLYDLSAGLVGSLSLEDSPIAPFLSVGLDLVSAAVPERDDTVTRG